VIHVLDRDSSGLRGGRKSGMLNMIVLCLKVNSSLMVVIAVKTKAN
jgi:hypothetical protein